MKYAYPIEQNDETRAGAMAGGKVIFGEFSQYAVYPIHTRHGAIAWFVVNVEELDEMGLPSVVRQEKTFKAAVACFDDNRFDKYLKLTAWLRKRYTRNGAIIVSRGFNPSIYTVLEGEASRRYLGTTKAQ